MLLDSFILPDENVENTRDSCVEISSEELSEVVNKIPYDMFSDVTLFYASTYRTNLSMLTQEDWNNITHLHIVGNSDFYTNCSLAKNGIKPGAYLNKTGNYLILIHLKEIKVQVYLEHYGKHLRHIQICHTALSRVSLGTLSCLESVVLHNNCCLTDINGFEALVKLKKLTISCCDVLGGVYGLENLICLEHFEIRNCKHFALLSGLDMLFSLKSLIISSCPSIIIINGLEGLISLTNLRVSWCKNLYSLFGIGMLSELTELDVSFCHGLTEIDELEDLSNLTHLDIQGCTSIRTFPDWSKLSSLIRLNIAGNTQLVTLSGLADLVNLTELDLSGCENLVSVFGLDKLTKLKYLDLSFCSSLKELIAMNGLPNLASLFLYGCTNLKILDLRGCINLSLLQGLTTLRQLTKLDLTGCKELTTLCFFEARFNTIEERVALDFQLFELVLNGCNRLTKLDLSGLQHLTFLQGMGSLTDLTDLYCAYSNVFFSSAQKFPPNLERLDLSNTPLRVVPDGIREIKSLVRLNLSGLQLEDLPDWLPEVSATFVTQGYGKGICIQDTSVDNLDISILSQSHDMVRKWFDERKKGNTEPLNEIKVVFLGDGEAGKSHTIARLLNDGKKLTRFDGQATPGIAIDDRTYTLDGRQIDVHFWDFGGQEILHSMHRMFLTKRTLYVILLNARDDTQDDRARYWLHNVKSFAPEAPVLLVLNKIDQNPNASINESGLRKVYTGLTEVVRMSALNFSRKEFNDTFTAAMLRQISAFKVIESPFTMAWRRLKDKLQSMTKHYIRSPEYMSYCTECGVEENEETRRSLLEWFKDLGVSFCYSESSMLEDYVILQPQWITNAVYILLYNQIKGNKNGIVSHEDLCRMLKRPDILADTIHRVLPNVFYTVDEVQYVLNVVRQFRLSYPVDGANEFFPMLCDRNETEIVKDFVGKPDVLEFQMVYEYLPNNVLHRLMVEMHRDLQTDNVWLTGAHFVQNSNNLSAVVKTDGNVLTICVRQGAEYPARIYLNAIKEHLERISQEMGLEITARQIVYNEDGMSETFDYDEVVGAQSSGLSILYSKCMKKTIPIRNILHQSGYQVAEDKERLIQDLLNTFRRLQANKLYWNATENDRNTFVRDALEFMNYIAKDQTLMGTGLGRKHPGELDIEIRKNSKAYWTIFEGLNLYGISRSEVEKWNSHLDKLLDNYNPIGLSFLIMVSYVACPKAQFIKISDEFIRHLKKYCPNGYTIREAVEQSASFDHMDETNYLRFVKCVYNCDGAFTTVYHFFIRLGGDDPQ